VTQPFVSKLRFSLITVISEPPAARTYTTKHGTTSTMTVSNIGAPERDFALGARVPPPEPIPLHPRHISNKLTVGKSRPLMKLAPLIGISDEMLRKYYRRELDLGAIVANAKVAETLFRQATEEGNTAAAIWWTKARMGWR
jgi:hypothetical protein